MTGVVTALGSSWWAGGLTLAERVRLPGGPAEPTEPERAARRLARWHKQHGLAESGQFDRRLADAGLDEARLLALLTELPTELAARSSAPPWAQGAERVVSELAPDRSLPPPPPDAEQLPHVGFAVVVSPFTLAAADRLDQLLAGHAGSADQAEFDAGRLRSVFVGQVSRRLAWLASRTLILELNVLRVTNRLTGDSPSNRFWSFVEHFSRPESFSALLDEYPVLARLLQQAADHAVASWSELIERLTADRSLIVDEILGEDPGPLVDAAFEAGDLHGGGRSVALLRFADGSRLVYKPRPLAAHNHFNRVLDWYNRALPGLDLRVLRLLDRGGYGWVEFVRHLPCATTAEVGNYYRRQGALLALLHSLAASDFHHENLVASGDQPVLVDLETLFHPSMPTATGAEWSETDGAYAALERSAIRVGLLPAVVWGEDGSSIDLSGVGGDRGELMPFKVVNWSGAGTDHMRVVRVQPEFPGSQNRPQLDGADIDPSRHVGGLLAGFRQGYQAIMDRREQFAALLDLFAADQTRVVVRPTQVYVTLLQESTHPDVMRDALDRDRIFDQLWIRSAGDEPRERLISHELADLWTGDVPLFTTRPGSTDLWSSGGVRLPDALAESGLDRVQRLLAGMSDSDLRTQEWIIAASMATRPHGTPDHIPQAEPALDSALDHRAAPPAADPDRLLAEARRLADRLIDGAYLGGGRSNWLGLEYVDGGRWRVHPLRVDLYNGFPGVALFLGQLAGLTGDQRYAEHAALTLGEVPRIVDAMAELPADQRSALPGGAAFAGLGGLAYALGRLRDVLDEPQLPGWLEQLVQLAGETVEHDEMLDVIGGSAGCLAVMHTLDGVAGAPEVADRCAARLVERAEPQEVGVAWRTTMDAIDPLTGFSHGAAGIGWALLRHAAVTGDQRCGWLGRQAFAFERAQYREDLANWPDHRVLDDPRDGAPLHAWCHGSVGVGLARVAAPDPDEDMRRDLDLAVHSMLAAGPSTNHCLCHGELGNLELLARAGVAGALNRRAGTVLDQLETTGPRCGTPGGIPTPGLLVGLAGIGHGLLRLAFPQRVPSVLLLEPALDAQP